MYYVTANLDNDVAIVNSVHTSCDAARTARKRFARQIGQAAVMLTVNFARVGSVKPNAGDRLATMREGLDIVAVADVR